MAVILSASDPDLWNTLGKRDPRNEVCVIPTDTVLGFSCAFSSVRAAERIRGLKGHADAKFIVLVRDLDQAESLVTLTPLQRKVLETHWPAAISFVLPRSDGSTLALRCPNDPFLQKFLTWFGEPLISTSCNSHGSPPLEDADTAAEVFGSDVDFYIRSSQTTNTNVPSTLVDLLGDSPRLLRTGAVLFPSQAQV